MLSTGTLPYREAYFVTFPLLIHSLSTGHIYVTYGRGILNGRFTDKQALLKNKRSVSATSWGSIRTKNKIYALVYYREPLASPVYPMWEAG